MANLTENAQWEAGIYQLAAGDAVQGGPGGISNVQAQQLANRTAFLKQKISDMPLLLGMEVTVGAEGDFQTINSALEYLTTNRYPTYKKYGIPAYIRLLPGFIMQEQVHVSGMNLGWIIIYGDDAQTTIARSSLTESFFIPSVMEHSGFSGTRYPAFAASNGATLPVICQRFNMDSSGTANERDGIVATLDSRIILSNQFVRPPGVSNAPGFGCCVTVGSSVSGAASVVFSGSGQAAVFTTEGSRASLLISDLTSSGTGIFCAAGSDVSASTSQITGCTTNGVRCDSGMVNMRWSHAMKGASPDPTDIIVSKGGIIRAYGSTGGLSQGENVLTADGIIFK